MPSSMQISSTFAPLSTCCRATLTASSYLPSLISFANLGEPATFVRSPIMMNTPACCVKGCDPDKRSGFISAFAATFSPSLTLQPQSGPVFAEPCLQAPLQSPQCAQEYFRSSLRQ